MTGNLDVVAKDVEVKFAPVDDPKYSNVYKSMRISRLIGHKTDWHRINDVSAPFGGTFRMKEIYIDPTMVPLRGDGRRKTNLEKK